MNHGKLLQGKLALVTGAASGIGRAIAAAYAQAGARVVITDLEAGACAATLEEVRAAGSEGWARALDVTDADAAVALAEEVAREIGPLDILVNNAGLLIREGIDSPRARANMRKVVDVNLFGTFHAIHAFLPALRRTRGCIVNIASGAAFIAQAGCLGYSASKGGVKMLTQAMAADLAPDGIRVNAIAPGVIETPMTDATRGNPERLQKFLARIPAGRVGQPREIAQPALFLASEMASYVTGVTLPVDGGVLAV
ncbi:MAG TPA: glucose 1-dehydrogenase [Ramlibacter sp.]|nr:glucose 1-dehydrogenase [Ramlibacter sp.]